MYAAKKSISTCSVYVKLEHVQLAFIYMTRTMSNKNINSYAECLTTNW